MSLHDRLKFNKKKRNKITDKNVNFLSFKKWLKDGGAEFPNLYFKSILIMREAFIATKILKMIQKLCIFLIIY